MHYKDLGRYYRPVLNWKKCFSFFHIYLPNKCGQAVSGCETKLSARSRGGRGVGVVATALVRLHSNKKNKKENLTKSSQR